jgi:hypothetical protein
VLQYFAVVVDLHLTNGRDVGPVVDGVGPEGQEEIREFCHGNT